MTWNDEKTDPEQQNGSAGTGGANDTTQTNRPGQGNEPANSNNSFPSGWSLMAICLALFLTLLCVGLDRAIVATAIPEITVEFNSLQDVGWYGSSFLLTMCCFQLLFGKLYAELSIKWVFLAALAIFEIGSIVCAAAPSSNALIIGRAVAGIGGAGLLSGGLIIIAHSVSVDRRPKYTGALGGAVGISQIVAPTLGGVFTDKLTWRWCFWINLPLGGLAFFVILFLVRLPSSATDKKRPTVKEFLAKFDLLGTLVLMPWVVCLLFALQWGGTRYPWGSWRMILLLVLFAVLFIVWMVVQVRQGDRATLPMRIIKRRSMMAGTSFMFLMFAEFFLVIYYVPIWFQSVRDVTAYQSGINLLSMSAATSIFVVISGFLTTRTGYFVPQMIASTVMSAVGCGLVYTFDRGTSNSFWIGSLILFGVGIGLGVQQPIIACQTIFKGPDISVATSTLIFMQSLASTIFLCVGQNVFTNQIIQEVRQLAPEVNPQDVVGVGAADLNKTMRRKYPDSRDGVLEAYNIALRQVFLITLIMACLTVFGALSMEWVSVKKIQDKDVRAKENHGASGSETPK